MAFQTGDRVRIEGLFKDSAGTAADPTAITLKILDPALATTTPVPTNPAVGTYRHDLDLNQVGRWTFRYEGTGAVVASTPDGIIDVEKSVFD